MNTVTRSAILLTSIHSGAFIAVAVAIFVTAATHQLCKRFGVRRPVSKQMGGKGRTHLAADLSGSRPARDPLETVFRQIAENIRQVFWMADCKEGRLIYVSPAMLDVWLIEPRILVDDPTHWFASIHPADRERAAKTISAMLSGAVESCEYQVVRADGEIRAVRNRSFPVRDASGVISRMAGIIEDVTSERHAGRALQESRDELVHHVNELKSENRERRLVEEQLRSAKDLAEAGSRAKSQFLQNISHELRTPLNGIMGMLHLASDTEDPADKRECLRSAENSAAHLLAIVDDILEFSEMDSRRLEIVDAPFDLRKCVRDVVKRMAARASAKNLEFAYFISANVPETVVGDAKRLAQVLTHLVSNAVKFSKKGSVSLEVRSGADGQGSSRLEFVVSDTGIGVPEDSRKAIFEAFTQADGSLTRLHGGLGLGLSICARLVGLMGGEMSLESKAGEGSRFGFTLHWTVRGLSPRPLSSNSATGQPVLVVEERPVSRSFAERTFLEEDHPVICCSNAQQALDLLAENPERFAAILLGSGLTTAGGDNLAELLSKEEYGFDHKLMLTLTSEAENAHAANRRGVQTNAYFPSPVDYDAIRERLRSIVAGSSGPTSKASSAKLIAYGRSLRILVAEDNPINQIVLTKMLQKQGHSVLTADHGVDALAKLEETGWDVDMVLMDMQMPELDGYETTKRIRGIEQARGGHLPIVAVTAHALAGDAERCINAGMDGYVTKPVQIEVLSRAMAKAIVTYRRVPDLDRKVS